MVRRVFGWVGACGLCLVVLAGCAGGNKSIVKAGGVVQYDDGSPVDGATVTFVPVDTKGMAASGLTNKDGTFDLTTKTTGDGAQKGDYKVTVVMADVVEGLPQAKPGDDPTKMMQEWAKKKAEAAKRPARKPIPPIYSSTDTTPLKASVDAPGMKVELKLRKS